MDGMGLELAKSGIDAAIGGIKTFVEGLAGPAMDEVGLLLADNVRIYRLRNQLRMLKLAKQMLEEAGLPPHTVPLKTLAPLLEGAAIEDNEDLATRWAALLANAAGPRVDHEISPSYPHILQQISSKEARLLDVIYDLALKLGLGTGTWAERGGDRESIIEVMRLSPQTFDAMTDNLFRLGLCSGRGTRLQFTDNPQQVFQLKDKGIISITQLGYDFVSACRKPPRPKNQAHPKGNGE